jgi:hypothetical protein
VPADRPLHQRRRWGVVDLTNNSAHHPLLPAGGSISTRWSDSDGGRLPPPKCVTSRGSPVHHLVNPREENARGI